MYAHLPLSPRKARYFPPSLGEATAKEERNYSFYYFKYDFDDTLCRILRYYSLRYCFVLLIRILPRLKNDGRVGLRFQRLLTDCLVKMEKENVSYPCLSERKRIIFCIIMLLKIQFACHCIRKKLFFYTILFVCLSL